MIALEDLIESMEATPDWVDMDLVRRGARAERIPMATASRRVAAPS